MDGRTDGWTDGNASKTVYPPVSLCSLGGYNNKHNGNNEDNDASPVLRIYGYNHGIYNCKTTAKSDFIIYSIITVCLPKPKLIQ